jgi:hypothetical protein
MNEKDNLQPQELQALKVKRKTRKKKQGSNNIHHKNSHCISKTWDPFPINPHRTLINPLLHTSVNPHPINPHQHTHGYP